MPDTILVLNAGSSSIKFQLFGAGEGGDPTRLLRGQIEGIGTARPRLSAKDAEGRQAVDREIPPQEAADVGRAQEVLGGWLLEHLGAPPVAVGHRVVHGGPDHAAPVLVDDALLDQLEALVPLAPLHQPNNLAPIRSIRARRPGLPQVACFDTAFHRGHPELADRYAIPEELYRAGVRRYGFHGLSYEYIASRLPEVAPAIADGRVVVAHLGSGCSACAMVGGRSVESTMGFTALDGLPMGTRPGQLDPGVVLYLAAQRRHGARRHRAPPLPRLRPQGPLGRQQRRPRPAGERGPARQAGARLPRLPHRAAPSASLAAAMGGVDGIVFTAGVGENAAPVRAAIVERCAWLGAELDPARNARNAPLITTDASRLPVHVLPTDEERMIARHTLRVLRQHR